MLGESQWRIFSYQNNFLRREESVSVYLVLHYMYACCGQDGIFGSWDPGKIIALSTLPCSIGSQAQVKDSVIFRTPNDDTSYLHMLSHDPKNARC